MNPPPPMRHHGARPWEGCTRRSDAGNPPSYPQSCSQILRSAPITPRNGASMSKAAKKSCTITDGGGRSFQTFMFKGCQNLIKHVSAATRKATPIRKNEERQLLPVVEVLDELGSLESRIREPDLARLLDIALRGQRICWICWLPLYQEEEIRKHSKGKKPAKHIQRQRKQRRGERTHIHIYIPNGPCVSPLQLLPQRGLPGVHALQQYFAPTQHSTL